MSEVLLTSLTLARVFKGRRLCQRGLLPTVLSSDQTDPVVLVSSPWPPPSPV